MPATHRWTRLSLLYPAGYLLSGGAALLVAPALALKLLLAAQPEAYGDVMPRMAGAVTMALGVLVVQVFRHRLEALHPTIIGVRFFLVGTWVFLYGRSHDPFFIVLAVMVGFGVVLSLAGRWVDARAAP
jgi:hypothetical protein